jgi:hypothetical protein
MARNNAANKRGRDVTGVMRAVATPLRFLRYAHNVLQFAKLMLQPHDDVEPPARAEWTEACPMPDDFGIESTTLPPVRLKQRAGAVPHEHVA